MTEKKDTGKVNCLPRARRKKSGDFTRKMAPQQAGLVREMVRCSRAKCKCANGSLHGPYYYRVWMVEGKRFKKYVKKSEVQAVLAAIAAGKQQRSEQQQSRERDQELIKEFRQKSREFRSLLQLLKNRR